MPIISSDIKFAGLYSALKELGLSQGEIDIYMLTLSLGSTTISNIAKHVTINRTNIYKLVSSLEKLGLGIFNKGTKRFTAASPSRVVELLKEKTQHTEIVESGLMSEMPNLLSMFKQSDLGLNIKIIEGQKQFLQTYIQVFEEAQDEIYFFGALKEFIESISTEFGFKRIQRRTEKKVKIKALIPEDDVTFMKSINMEPNSEKELRETRTLPKHTQFSTSYYVFANKVIIWQTKTPMGLLIEDAYIVQMFKSTFEMLWAVAKTFEN
jgi:sugar-specific transcriptional regulator TrmB